MVVLLMLIPLLAPSESGAPAGLATIAKALGIAAIKVATPSEKSDLLAWDLHPRVTMLPDICLLFIVLPVHGALESTGQMP